VAVRVGVPLSVLVRRVIVGVSVVVGVGGGVTVPDRVRDTDGVAVFDALTLLVTVAVAGVVVFEPLVERE
jgi:hypothetical protein